MRGRLPFDAGGAIIPTAMTTIVRELNPRRDPALDFPIKEYGELDRADYDTLGFMAGLEVHQQLLTRSKLFCRCPAGQYVDHHDAEVLRHMRPTLSELGEYDGTALMEFKTRKEIVYLLERGTVCTYEIDDTPPFEIDDEAVRIAIELAEVLGMNLVSELHVMRKQYLDGSIPTGFQRTAMVALGGAIPLTIPELGVDRELHLRQLSLEEDSCREVSDVGHRITFRTDRLGMPLTEIVTEPELYTPLEVQAAGQLLAEVARATGKIRRGPGAARQDVNVSIAGGRRVEIKGVSYHRRLPQLVHIEAQRQLNLLRIKNELDHRGVTRDLLEIPDEGLPWEASELVERTLFAVNRDETACAVRLPGFGGLLSHATQPRLNFAHELSERVRVIGCPIHRPFMTHSDDSMLTESRWSKLRKSMKGDSSDAIVLLWGSERDTAIAAREVLLRATDALIGVPAETRQANADGTTGFERILPGAERMYPDTDTPPLPIQDSLVETIRVALAETPWARERRYMELGLTADSARRLARASWADLFDDVEPESGIVARRLAASLAKRLPFHWRAGRPQGLPDPERARPLVRAIERGETRIEALDRLIDMAISSPAVSVDEIILRHSGNTDDDDRLEEAVRNVATDILAMPGRSTTTLVRWAMGQVMPKFLGKVDPMIVRTKLEAVVMEPAPEAVS